MPWSLRRAAPLPERQPAPSFFVPAPPPSLSLSPDACVARTGLSIRRRPTGVTMSPRLSLPWVATGLWKSGPAPAASPHSVLRRARGSADFGVLVWASTIPVPAMPSARILAPSATASTPAPADTEADHLQILRHCRRRADNRVQPHRAGIIGPEPDVVGAARADLDHTGSIGETEFAGSYFT